MKRIIFILGCLALLIAGGAGYYYFQKNDSDQNVELKKIKVTYQEEGITPSFVLETGIEKGIFKKNGIEIEKNPSLTNVDKIFTSGQTDVVVFGSNWLSLYLQEVDMKWIGTYSNFRQDYYVSRYSKEDIKSVKKVGIKKLGSPDELNMRLILEAWGVDVSSVEFVLTPADNVKIDQLQKNGVDLISLIEKDGVDKLTKEGFKALDAKDALAGINMGFEMAVLDSNYNERKEDLEKFIKAVYETDQYILNNKQEAVNVLKDKFELDDARAGSFYDGYTKALKEMKYIPTKDAIVKVMDAMTEMIKPKMPGRDLSGLVYPDFAQKAVDSLGL